MTEIKNKPVLRFTEFNDEWEEKKINAILTIGSGKDCKHLGKGNIPVYGTGGYMLSVDKYLYEGESVGIGRKGTIDKPVFLSGKFWTVDTLFYTHSFKKTLPKFVYLIFQNINWKEYNEASGVPSLSKTTIEKIKINLPTIEEQTKIANFLTSVDTKIDQLSNKKELLESYKKSIMQKIFSQEIRFKNDDGNDYSEWVEKKLGDLCKIAKSGGTPTSTNKEYYDGNIPFLSISDMTSQGKYLKYTSKYVSQKGLDSSASWLVPVNSIIYSMYASVGFVCINKIPVATSQAVLNLILKDDISLEYIYYFLVDIKQSIIKFIETGTQGNLNAQNVKSFRILLPTIEEQTKIANFLTSIDKKIDLVNLQLEKVKSWKQGLLQQMFI